MANPRRQDDRVEKLAALAQIMNSFQVPQMRQQEEQKRRALEMLGLMMNQQQQKEALDVTKDRGASELRQIFLSKLMDDPNVPWEQKRAAISEFDPTLKTAGEAMHRAAGIADVQKRAPEFAAIYEAGKKDPSKLKQGIEALRMTMPEATFNNQDWDRLNQGLPATPPPTASPFASVLPNAGATSSSPYGPAPAFKALIPFLQRLYPMGAFSR